MSEERTILIIDDEPSFVKNVVSYLEMHGYKCLKAMTGEDGLRSIKENSPDVVILDILMPLMDGYSMYKATGRQRKDIKWIVVTGKDKLQSLFEIEDVNVIMQKPINLGELKDTIDGFFSDEQ